MGKKILTLVTEAQSGRGTVFTIGVTSTCIRCGLFNFCVGKLRPGLRYKVVENRGVKHYCPLLKERMTVALVEEMPVRVSIKKSIAIENLSITYAKLQCQNRSCRYYNTCVLNPVKNGEKLKITKILEYPRCPLGFSLAVVEAELQL